MAEEQDRLYKELLAKTKTIVQLKFYADLKGEYNNKLFCFNVETWENAEGIYTTFLKNSNRIRSLFLTANKDIYIGDSLCNAPNVQSTRRDENGNLIIPRFYSFPDRVVIRN
jgi:hypothetical protein